MLFVNYVFMCVEFVGGVVGGLEIDVMYLCL